jgi:hypothetical protein
MVPLRSPISFRHGSEKSRVPDTLLKVGSINEEVDVVAEGTAKTQLAETPGKPARVRLGGDVQTAKLLNKVIPVYPTTAKSAGIEGTVITACRHWDEGESAVAACGEYPDRS